MAATVPGSRGGPPPGIGTPPLGTGGMVRGAHIQGAGGEVQKDQTVKYKFADVGTIYPPTPVTPAGTINKVAQDIEATSDIIAGANNVLPICYGDPVRIAPLIIGIVGSVEGGQTYLNLTGALSHGPIGGVTAVYLDDKLNMAGMTYEAMLGAPDQVALPSLVTAYAQHAITYTDRMLGVAYLNIKLAAGMPLSNVPRINVVLRGRTVLDMRTSTIVNTSNPVLCLADFIKSPVYGAGRDYDVASFSTCATWNDTPVAAAGNEPLRRIALAITNKQSVDEWIETLAVYANVDLYVYGGIYYAVPRRAKASSFVFNDGNIIQESIQIARTAARQVPTISVVKYTDTTVIPWSTRDCPPAMIAGVEEGTVPARDSSVSLPGITRMTQAARDALERLNWNIYGNTSYQWGGFDDAAFVRKGDLITLSHAIGIVNKAVWVNAVDDLGFGRYQFRGTSYSPEIFSGTPPTSISPIDSSALIPGLIPPAVGAVTGAEELYQKQNGDWDSRVRFEWTLSGSDVAFDHYALAINDVTNPAAEFQVDSRNTSLPSMVTYALQEGRKYRLYVLAVSVLGIPSAVVSSNIVSVLGKLAKPGDVPGFSGTEAGGTVYLKWNKAIDIDVVRYEVRRGVVGSAWDAKTQVALLDALAAILPGQPEGTQEYSIKALDSVGGYSVNPATISIVVTVDSGSVLLSYTYNTYSPTNMQVVGNAYEHGSTNWALAGNGGTMAAQSIYDIYSPSYANNGQAGNVTVTGMFISAQNALPQWLSAVFPAARWIDTVVVYFVQDNTTTVPPPGDTTVSTLYAPTAFRIDATSTDGTGLVTLATVTGNNLVKRTITFPPYFTKAVNITVTALPAGANGYVRVAEFEAYGVASAVYSSNVASPNFGTTASASTEYAGGGYPATLVNNGNVTGGANQYWASNGAAMPQYVVLDFKRTRVINKVVIYGLQDGFGTALPTDTMTGTQYLPTAFDVQLWNVNTGGWLTVASVVGNNLVKRTITFPAQPTTGVLINIKGTQYTSGNLAMLVEVEAYSPARDTSLPYYTINYAGLWADGADVPNNAVGTFDDSLKDNLIGFPTAAAASQLTTGVLDQGSVLNGRWSFQGTAQVVDSLAGAPFDQTLITRAIDYSTDNLNFFAGVPDTVFAARYVRLRATCPTGYVMRAMQDWTLNFSTTLREERGTATIDATGRITVTLAKYARYVTIQLTVQSGGAGRFAVYDAVVVGASVTNKFDIVLFNAANAQVAGVVGWLFQGLN